MRMYRGDDNKMEELLLKFDTQELLSSNSPQILNVLSTYSGIFRSIRQKTEKSGFTKQDKKSASFFLMLNLE